VETRPQHQPNSLFAEYVEVGRKMSGLVVLETGIESDNVALDAQDDDNECSGRSLDRN